VKLRIPRLRKGSYFPVMPLPPNEICNCVCAKEGMSTRKTGKLLGDNEK
jgi:transposase-like protein